MQYLPPLRNAASIGDAVLMSPEMASLIFGLTMYSAAYIAEIVRGGIIAVPRGQWEAADRSAYRSSTRHCSSSRRRRCGASAPR